MDAIRLLSGDFKDEKEALAALVAAGMLTRAIDVQFDYPGDKMPLTGQAVPQRDGTITWRSLCPRCHEASEVRKLDPFAVNAWQNNGVFIQDAFPHLTKGQRETLQSGYHEECFDLDWFPR